MNVTKMLAAFAVIIMMTVVAAPAVSAEDSVDLTATVLEPKPEIGIELNATALSFGSLYPGNTSDPQDLKVSNIGLKTVDVTAEASDDQGQEALFVPGLLIDSASWTEYESTLAEDESDDTQLALHVPDEYASRGDVSGGAIFWAEEHMGSSPVENFTYTSDGSAITITGYVGPGGDVIIPSTIDGLPVITIGSEAFRGCTSLTSVTIPDSVTIIGDEAFYDNTAMTSAIIPDGVTSIGSSAFSGCSAMTSVIIPDSVTSIGESAFRGCSAMTSVIIPDSVTSIGAYAFRDCAALGSVAIGNNVTSIGTSAFRDCAALGSVAIGNNVTSIGNYAFSYSGLISVIIPDSVTSIGNSAIRECTSLISVTIGIGVTNIGSSTFRDCTALTSMTFEGNAPTVGSNWAYGCTNLVVYFHAGATGFTVPTWNGVPCYPTEVIAPVADFSADVTSGDAPLTVQFTDLSTNYPTSWSWDFGDGTTSAEQNPSHVYSAAGTYTVTLTATNAGGSDTETKADLIVVTAPPAPVADFEADKVWDYAPEMYVQFTDLSTNAPTSWSWEFGDGATSDEREPLHTYAVPGDYTVTLTVSNAGGSDDEVKVDYIHVEAPVPVAGFDYQATGLSVLFEDLSENMLEHLSLLQWHWDFGDGATLDYTAEQKQLTHVFSSPGTYHVVLTVTNDYGTDTFETDVTVA